MMLKIEKDLAQTMAYKSIKGLLETEIDRQRKVRGVLEAMNAEQNEPPEDPN